MIPRPVLAAWLLTVALEAPCVALVYRGDRRRMAAICAVVTTLTNLLMNLVLPRWTGTGARFLLVGELGSVAVEALAYAAVSRPRSLARGFLASALANGVSFGVGWIALPP